MRARGVAAEKPERVVGLVVEAAMTSVVEAQTIERKKTLLAKEEGSLGIAVRVNVFLFHATVYLSTLLWI